MSFGACQGDIIFSIASAHFFPKKYGLICCILKFCNTKCVFKKIVKKGYFNFFQQKLAYYNFCDEIYVINNFVYVYV